MKKIILFITTILGIVFASSAQQSMTLVNNRGYPVLFTVSGSCSPGPAPCTNSQTHLLNPGASLFIPDFNGGIPGSYYAAFTTPTPCPLLFRYHYANAQNFSGPFCSGGGLTVGDNNCVGSPVVATFATVTTPPPCIETYTLDFSVSALPPFPATVTAN